jgi:CheY-like chemotaxis protein
LEYLATTEDQPFILLSDINMPGMTGLQLKKNIQDDPYLASKGIPFVFISTNSSKESVRHAHALSVVEYLYTINHSEDYPCLVILDNNMPVLTGREALSLIRKESKYRSIPIVIFTTSANEQDRTYFYQQGAFLYIKPLTIGKYREIFTELLTHCNTELKEAIRR